MFKLRSVKTTLTLALCILALTSCTRIFSPVTPQDPEAKPQPQDHTKQIIFAGLSGRPPRYIESGPYKGIGWVEYQTQEVRKGMKEDGFEIKQEWMTPARIEHEFRIGSPICTYPAEWSNPRKLFENKPDRIYSIPLDLGGESNQSIMFNRGDFPKFKKHLDAKGDVKLDSLFHDLSLKTLLIRDKDYGQVNRSLTEINVNGEQVVRKEFLKNVTLWVVRDNRQIAEMLNARRFDYTFSDAIEDQDLKASGIDPSQFMHLNFRSSSVSSKDDPNLVFVSIACANNPLTIQAMPYFNRWISLSRGIRWTERTLKYRKKIDPQLQFHATAFSSTTERFRGEFEKGALDFWYSLQQNHLPKLLLFPPRELEPSIPEEKNSRSPIRWAWFSANPGELTLVNEAVVPLTKKYGPNYDQPYSYEHVFPGENIGRYFTETQKKQLKNLALFQGKHSSSSFQGLSFLNLTGIRKLTLFASGLKGSDFEVLRPLLSSPELKELTIYGSGALESKVWVKYLPKTLTYLNLTNSSLMLSEIQHQIKGMPLKGLHLSDAQVSANQMKTLIEKLPDTIEDLSLGYHRTSWTPAVAQVFGGRIFPNLKSLDLENCCLSDVQLLFIAKNLPKKLQILRLGLNQLTQKSLSVLFSRDFPALVELDLSESKVGSGLPKILRLPSQIKMLKLTYSNLTPQTLSHLKLPSALETLDISNNNLGNEGAEFFNGHLSDRMQLLNLSHTGIGIEGMRALIQPGQKRFIQDLNLAENSLDDQAIEALAKIPFKIEGLDLRGNRITNAGVDIVSRTWLTALRRIDFSSNLITEEGTRTLAKNLSPELEELSLGSLLSLDLAALALHLPAKLKTLDLSHNQLGNSEIQTLAPHLPSGLIVLDLSYSAFTAKGARALAQFMPKSLHELLLDSTPLGGEGIGIIAKSLPQSLRMLHIGNGELSAHQAKLLGTHLPMGLQDLRMLEISFSNGSSLAPVVKAIPPSLVKLGLASTPLSIESAQAFHQSWPSNIRDIYLQGIETDKNAGQILVKSLPATIERVSFLGSEMDDTILTEAAQNSLENLHTIQLYRNSFTGIGLGKLLKAAKKTRSAILLGNSRVTGVSLRGISREILESIRYFSLTNLALSNQDLVQLVKKLPNELWSLDLTSSGLTTAGVGPLIEALPKGLQELFISGNAIGQTGLEKFRAYKARKEKETGVVFELSE